MLAIATQGLPAPLVAALKHLASLHNPDFYKKQKMRYSTFGTPRFVMCFDASDPDWLRIPRGLADEAAKLVASAGGDLCIDDDLPSHAAITARFTGELTPVQANGPSRQPDGARVAETDTRDVIPCTEAPTSSPFPARAGNGPWSLRCTTCCRPRLRTAVRQLRSREDRPGPDGIDRRSADLAVQKMAVSIPLTDDERATVDDGHAALNRLLERLADVPTPAGPTPRELSLPPGAVALPIVETDARARDSTRRPCCPPKPLG
ncbi:hypothetical protein [Streptomyces sp. NPDC097981]|uniref:hypothetical protein n=1 Tax=Streptomyces sp. NPDC097981 TaxID=3155428 RepID=UPI00332D8E41